ncbi:MAG: Hsp20/alpha crystallin family protein [Candidatus Uhrbacteria bacterium]
MSPTKQPDNELDWLPESEGQLAVDVLEDEQNIYIRAAVAGTQADDLDIVVTHDTVTIRGKRYHGCDTWENATSHLEECYWGVYSRSVVLPSHVQPEAADAVIKNGILTITIPKIETSSDLNVIELN